MKLPAAADDARGFRMEESRSSAGLLFFYAQDGRGKMSDNENIRKHERLSKAGRSLQIENYFVSWSLWDIVQMYLIPDGRFVL